MKYIYVACKHQREWFSFCKLKKGQSLVWERNSLKRNQYHPSQASHSKSNNGGDIDIPILRPEL